MCLLSSIRSCFRFLLNRFKRCPFKNNFSLKSYIKDRRKDNSPRDRTAKIDNLVRVIPTNKAKYKDYYKVSKRTQSLGPKMTKMCMEEKPIQKYRKKWE